jgi:hypothetical protein
MPYKARTFRKQPLPVQAMKFQGDLPSHQAICKWLGNWPHKHIDVLGNRFTPASAACSPVASRIVINTHEGEMAARHGDWIVCGVSAEFYPVRADIFEQSYDLIEDGKVVDPSEW